MRGIIAILFLAGINTVAGNGFDLLIPQPHEVVSSEGRCKLPAVLGFTDEFKDARLSLQIVRMSPGGKPAESGFLTIKKMAMSKGDEAYELKITPTGVEVSAAAPVGAFYALKTLEQLARGGAPLPCGTVRDWPDLKFRGIHLMTGWVYVPTIELLRQMVEEMADLKYNKLVIEYDEQFPLKNGAGDAYTVDELRGLVKLAQDNFIEVIPLIDSLGHMNPYLWPKENIPLREDPAVPREMCPQNPDALKFIKNIWTDVLGVHKESSYAHITGDEVFFASVKPCPKCKPYADAGTRGQLYCRYYSDLSKWVRDQGKTPLMWGDMILKHPEALEGFPRDVVICDWNYAGPEEGVLRSPFMEYDPKGLCDESRKKLFSPYWNPEPNGGYNPFPYLKFFGDQGFKTLASSSACTGTIPPHRFSRIFFFNNQLYSIEAKRQEKSCLGLLNTIWTTCPVPGVWFGVAAGGEYAWNCRKEPFEDFVRRFSTGFLRRADWTGPLLQLADTHDYKGDAIPSFEGDVGSGATPMAAEVGKLLKFSAEFCAFQKARRLHDEEVFRSNAAGKPEVIDLTNAATCALKDALPPKARGVVIPPGEHSYAGLPFKLDAEHVISLSAMAPKSVTMPVGRKTNALVLWDMGYNAYPDKTLATMRIEYADKSEASFEFIGSKNILDWSGYAKTPKDSSCVAAWRGHKDTSEDLVSWLTCWRNPRPDAEVASITLTPAQTGVNSYFIVLGITALVGEQPVASAKTTSSQGDPDELLARLKQRASELYPLWMKKSYVDKSAQLLFSPFKQ